MKRAKTKQQQTLHQPLRTSPVLAPNLRKACSHLFSWTGRMSTSVPLSPTSASLCLTNHFNMVQTHLLLSHPAGGLAEYNTTNTTLKITMTKSMLAWKGLKGNRTEDAGWTENMQWGKYFHASFLGFSTSIFTKQVLFCLLWMWAAQGTVMLICSSPMKSGKKDNWLLTPSKAMLIHSLPMKSRQRDR